MAAARSVLNATEFIKPFPLQFLRAGHQITDSKCKSFENTFLQPGHEEHVSKVEAVAPEGDVVQKGAQVGEGSWKRTGNGAEGFSEEEQLEASYKDSVICAFGGDLDALRQQEDGSSQPKLIALALESTWKSFSPFEQQMFRGTSF